MQIAVVIPTYNRKNLLDRCLKSVVQQQEHVHEIIVVDDASTDGTEAFMQEYYPDCRYIRLEKNQGVCMARNIGIQQCTATYALLLDSDDELCEDALQQVIQELKGFQQQHPPFSAYFFLRDKAQLKNKALSMIRPQHIIQKNILGNCTEILLVTQFIEKGYQFPELISKVGGENLLWLEIAKKEGIPFFNRVITRENEDANNRLTSIEVQLERSYYHALLQEQTISRFKEEYLQYDPFDYHQRLNACSLYWKLSGDFKKAFFWAKQSLHHQCNFHSLSALLFSLLPRPLAKRVFILWRRKSNDTSKA